jgi:hypothetical protein
MSQLPIIKRGKTYVLAIEGFYDPDAARNLIEMWEQATGAKAVLVERLEVIAELETVIEQNPIVIAIESDTTDYKNRGK